MALTDFWQLKDNQELQTKQILNIYHTKRIDAGADALDVANAFTFSILQLNFRGMQDDNLMRSTVEVQNLGDPTDFASISSVAFGGTSTGEHFVGFTAAAIQFNRTRTDMKNGQKRFVMGEETDAANGTWDGAFLAQMDLVGQTIIDPWVTLALPLVDVCSFVILKRFCVVPLQDPCVKYRLPNTDAEIDNNHYVPMSFISRNRQRSQVSRKRL